MKHRLAAITWALATGFAATNLSAQAAVFGDGDTTPLASISEAIQGLEDDVGAALHNLPADENGDIESYAYVELNLQAAHERLNNVFMLVAVSIYMDSRSDELLILDVLYWQILPRSKNYLNEKTNAIASMAAARPSKAAFAGYRARADALLAKRAVPFLDELYERIAAVRR
jgi:hypothetical protein